MLDQDVGGAGEATDDLPGPLAALAVVLLGQALDPFFAALALRR